MLEQGLWALSLLFFTAGAVLGGISLRYPDNTVEHKTLVSNAVNVAFAACVFALTAMWIY